MIRGAPVGTQARATLMLLTAVLAWFSFRPRGD